MPAPLAPGKRAAILKDIQAGKARNQIARDHHVSGSTVTRIARELPGEPFDRSNTLKGARARQADNAAKRVRLQSDLLDDAQRVRARIWGPCKVVVGGPEGAEIVTLDEAPLADIKAGFTSIGVIIDKDLAYERATQRSDGASHAESVMGRLAAALTEAFADDLPPETPLDDDA